MHESEQGAEVTTQMMTSSIPKRVCSDSRFRTAPDDFCPAGDKVWETAWSAAETPFDELIYYWNIRLEREEGFRLWLQVRLADGVESPWMYAGFWGRVSPAAERPDPIRFDGGVLEQDHLKLSRPGVAWRFRVTDEGRRPLSGRPVLGVIATSYGVEPEAAAGAEEKPAAAAEAGEVILDLPMRHQTGVCGERIKSRCQSAALATAMEYFGQRVPLEQIIAFTTDPEYRTYGIWPRTINAAYEFGFEAYLDRFRDWDQVRRTVAENKVILCSMVMPEGDDYVAPPYGSITGHIVALNGLTDDGRVIVTDSCAAVGDDGYRLQWLIQDFEKVWIRNKGGVGMVICPPPGAERRGIADLPPFPERRPKTERAE